MITTLELMLLLGLCAVVILTGLILSFSAAIRRNKAVREVAGRLGGSYGEGGLFGEPVVTFRLSGREAWLGSFSGDRDSSPFTRVVVNVRGHTQGTLHIAPEGFASGFVKIYLRHDVAIGDPEFDRRYVVNAQPEALARQVFHPTQRAQAITSVLRLAGLKSPTIDLDRTYLTVQARAVVTDVQQLMAMVQTAEEFLSYCFIPQPGQGDMQIVEVLVATQGKCPVCGADLIGDQVRCELCRTPHHSECWKYMGRCSTYACKSRRSVA